MSMLKEINNEYKDAIYKKIDLLSSEKVLEFKNELNTILMDMRVSNPLHQDLVDQFNACDFILKNRVPSDQNMYDTLQDMRFDEVTPSGYKIMFDMMKKEYSKLFEAKEKLAKELKDLQEYSGELPGVGP